MSRKHPINAVPAGSLDDLDGRQPDLPPELDGDVVAEEEPAGKKPRGRRRAQTAEEPDNFLVGQAGEDRKVAKAKHVDDGLEAVAEMVDRLRKGLAYARAVHDLDVKLAVLSEVADTAASVTDDARRAVRSATAERRNVQPSGGR